MTSQIELLAQLRERAVRAFGESEGKQFIHRPLRAFDGKSALQLVEQNANADQVFTYLDQLTAAEEEWKRNNIRGCEH